MLYFNFKNYEEFKVLFGKRVGNNGKNIRSNGILLSFYKHEFKCKRFYSLKTVMSVDHIYREFTNCLGYAEHSLANGMHFAHPDYIIDSFKGVCEDGDSRCIRYTKNDGRVYKMKAGKLMRKLLERYDIVGKFCEQAVIYVCERFAEEWRSFVESKYGFKYTLHVNDNFYKIYSYNYCKRDFNSCMMNDDQYSFYEDAVDASAAYLTNEEDEIIARCVIFNKVEDEDTGKVFRLAERQYSTDQDNVLKQILIDRLIEGNYIDGYKRVGVDCHNARAFVMNDGTPMNERHLSIQCNLDYGDTISYQDSFKWYDMDYRRADNYGGGDIDLATTDSTLGGDDAYDEYHDRYCAEVRTVYVWNERYGQHDACTCDVDDLGDFTWCERYCDYYEETLSSSYEADDIPREYARCSEYLNDYLWDDRSTWCEEMEDYLPDDGYDYYFDKWKEENWEYDEFNEEYVKEVVEAYIWDDEEYVVMKVGVEYAEEILLVYEGEYYSVLNEDGIPFNLVEELEEAIA